MAIDQQHYSTTGSGEISEMDGLHPQTSWGHMTAVCGHKRKARESDNSIYRHQEQGMGLQDRNWYAEDRKRRDAMKVNTGRGWNSQPAGELKQSLFWMSVMLNVVLSASLAYVLIK